MIKKMGYDWQLRQCMADRGMFQTSDLAAPLAERGIVLSREQLWRLVSQAQQRLSLDVLAAMCDILGCGPSDLIEVRVENVQVSKTGHRPGRGRPGTSPHHGSAAPPDLVTTPAKHQVTAALERLRHRVLTDVSSVAPDTVDGL